MTKVAALLMAAGNSRRMGGPNKLLLDCRDAPLMSFAVSAVREAKFSAQLMISGRDHETTSEFGRIADFEIVHNPKFETGFGTSLAVGFSALLDRPEITGAIVVLADMPLITAAHINQMIASFEKHGGIIRAAHHGQPGNPVLIPRALFAKMARFKGEESGKQILAASGIPLTLVEIGIAAISDIDTPVDLARL